MINLSPWTRQLSPHETANRYQKPQIIKQPLRSGALTSGRIGLSIQQILSSTIRRAKPDYRQHASSQTDLIIGDDSLTLDSQQKCQEISQKCIQNGLIYKQQQRHRKILSMCEMKSIKREVESDVKLKQNRRRPQLHRSSRIINIVIVHHGALFIQFLLSSNYFENSASSFFFNHPHTSYQLVNATISQTSASNGINNYQDIMMLTKKSRVYDQRLQRLVADSTQSFITYCPDLLILSCHNLAEELKNKKKIQKIVSEFIPQVSMKRNLKLKINELF